jgi:predicted XRE-type DNA-binding protein
MKAADFETGSGNIFRDLGLGDADELDAKAKLAIEVAQILERRRLTQSEAATILKIDQPKVSALVRGHLEKFSLERLAQFLMRLGCDVDIRVYKRGRNQHGTAGKLSVKVA